MLGIRLNPREELMLSQHARDVGRPKSALAREWIIERLDRESVDAEMRRAARILAEHDRPEEYIEADFDD